ncbi:MAG TPA: ABC transporter ATP-binding protein/permease [Roseiarcus sp.]|nr:ABC transporter ATP-binding protein/permease [Roseiarcus sp.]
MRLLSFAVGLFAVAAFLTGLNAPGTMVFLLTGAAAACAVAVFLSDRLSAFLKVFETIFACETIIFGTAFLIDQLGLWPQAYANYTLPESLPFAVALFGVFVYAISFIPVVRKMTGIVDPYFEESAPTRAKVAPFPAFSVAQNKLATAALSFLIVINQAEVALDVRLSYFRADFTNALKNMDQPEVWRQIFLIFVPVVTVLVVAVVVEYVVMSTFIIRWRRWLTASYAARWLRHGAHYRMLLSGSPTDNPDQRISQDIYSFIDGTGTSTNGYGIYGYSVTALQNLTSLVSYALVLWSLSSGFTLPGLALVIPGILFWVALGYASAGTLIAHWIGRALVNLYFAQQRFEANFRFGLARVREYSEQIALLAGEDNETRAANARFVDIFNNYMRIVRVRKKLLAFQRTYGQASVLIPYLVSVPFYFLGKITMGALNQIGAAFNSVNESMNFFVTYYVSLAEFRAVLDRLTSFDAAIERAEKARALESGVKIDSSPSGDIVLDHVALRLPDGRALVKTEELALAARQSTLVVGPSGVGKSTLFRAIAGIWPYGEGAIHEPEGRIMLLPQRPYIPLGALRDAVAYPADASTFDDATLCDALNVVGLDHLVDRLDDTDNWQMALSGGEQQRLSAARALIVKPKWLFLDEATSALDQDSETRLYHAIAKALPDTTIVSIGHRATLSAFHRHRWEVEPRDGEPATIREAAVAA